MEERLHSLIKEYEEVQSRLADPAVLSQRETAKPLFRRSKELEPIITKARLYLSLRDQLDQARTMLQDAEEDLREMAEEEIGRAHV